MSSYIRSLQRNMIREECYKRDKNLKNFHRDWNIFKYGNPDGKEKKKSISKSKANFMRKLLNRINFNRVKDDVTVNKNS